MQEGRGPSAARAGSAAASGPAQDGGGRRGLDDRTAARGEGVGRLTGRRNVEVCIDWSRAIRLLARYPRRAGELGGSSPLFAARHRRVEEPSGFGAARRTAVLSAVREGYFLSASTSVLKSATVMGALAVGDLERLPSISKDGVPDAAPCCPNVFAT